MRGYLAFAAALLALAAQIAARSPTNEQIEVMDAVDGFFAALRSSDKTALATTMLSEGTIFVHNRMNPDKPRVDMVPVAQHLERWAQGTREVAEWMIYETVLVDGDMAQVWGPYYFTVEGTLSHCGINSLSMVKVADGGWKVANSSFTMEPPGQCDEMVAEIDSQTESSE